MEYNQIKTFVATFDIIATMSTNIPVLLVLLTGQRLRQDITSRIILTLTVSDLGLGVLCPCISAAVAWSGPDSVHSDQLYAFHAFAINTFTLVSIWHLTIISVVKYYVIVKPLTYSITFTEQRVIVMILSVWTACLTFAGIAQGMTCHFQFDWMTIVSHGEIKPDIISALSRNTAVAYISSYTWVFLVYLLPGIIMMCIYGKIFMVVKKQLQNIHASHNCLPSLKGDHRWVWVASVKSAKNLFIICSAYLMNYLPLFSLFLPQISYPAWYVFCAYWLNMYSGAVNALLYIVTNRLVKAELKMNVNVWLKFTQDCAQNLMLMKIPRWRKRSCRVETVPVL